MDYREFMREGEAELAAMPAPTKEEVLALAIELAEEGAAQAALDEAEQAPEAEPCPACGQPLLPGEVHCPACPFVLPYVPRGEYGER